MTQRLDQSPDELKPVEILWSEKYACPVFLVEQTYYIPDTGEYAGYFEDAVIDLVSTDSKATTSLSNPPEATSNTDKGGKE